MSKIMEDVVLFKLYDSVMAVDLILFYLGFAWVSPDRFYISCDVLYIEAALRLSAVGMDYTLECTVYGSVHPRGRLKISFCD